MSEIVEILNNILENIVDNGIIKEDDPSAKGKLEKVIITDIDDTKTIIFSPVISPVVTKFPEPLKLFPSN